MKSNNLSFDMGKIHGLLLSSSIVTGGVNLEYIMFTAGRGVCREWHHCSLHIYTRKLNCNAAVCQC